MRLEGVKINLNNFFTQNRHFIQNDKTAKHLLRFDTFLNKIYDSGKQIRFAKFKLNKINVI